MDLRRTRAPVVLISLLAVGAWAGSSLAQGATRATLPLPTVSVPGVSVPVAGLTVSTPAVTVPVAPVTVNVPPVTASVPAVTVSTPIAGVTTPSVTVATPPVGVTTPSSTVTVPAISATAPLPAPTAVSQPVAAVVNATTTAVAAATKVVASTATKAVAQATGTTAAATASKALKPVAATVAAKRARTATTATSRSSGTAPAAVTRGRAARLRAARLRAARVRAARARHARLVRVARQRRRVARALRLSQVQPPPQAPATPLILDPALPVLNGVAPYLLPDLTAGSTATSIDAFLLPISAAAAAAPHLVGVSVRGASTFRATAPPQRAFPPTGGFNGASRFAMFLLGEFSIATTPAPTPSSAAVPVTARTPVLTPVAGGRSQAAVSGGTRGGMSIETPLGRIAVSRDGYVFGSAHYPLASVRGVATTVLISLAALAAVAALLGLVGAADRLRRGGGGRRGSGSRRPARGTREDLYSAARRKNIPGRSRMSKAELKRALDER